MDIVLTNKLLNTSSQHPDCGHGICPGQKPSPGAHPTWHGFGQLLVSHHFVQSPPTVATAA